ncbi:asparagine synthetase B family protein [Streptomyces sp. NPDC004327]|uniref:asparagine synthetase B family protein n=1 Tax=Streptomyces sp. NPDC004327 TaxID=3364699 RepID=UPI003688B666
MSRIFGAFGAPNTAVELNAVAGRQLHGGRDGTSVLRGDTWSLGCNRLAVLDPCGGAQPYRCPRLPGIAVVFDGEIYNHHQLRRRLRARGHVFTGTCDGSVLPALYAEYGTRFAEHLEGMFTIAVIDLRRRPLLVLAADDHGMKTLYYHTGPDGSVRFASELPGLLAFGQVPATERAAALDEYLSVGTYVDDRTALEGIRTLPPGTTALATGRDGLRVQRRTAPLPASDGPADLGDLLYGEMARLTSADVPLCGVVTEGADSHLVNAIATRQLRELDDSPLRGFHVVYRGRWHSSVCAAARRSGTLHHDVLLDPDELVELLPRTVWHLGQPHADPAAPGRYALFRAIRGAGYTVALTAAGAGELFDGHERVQRALTTPPELPWIGPYLDSLASVPRTVRASLYSADYRDYLRFRGTAADRLAETLHAGRADRAAALSAVETGWRLPAHQLRQIDHVSTAWSVEARFPYLQPAVSAFAGSLRARPATGDTPLFTTAQRYLPAGTLRRSARSTDVTADELLRPGSALMDLAQDILRETHLDERWDRTAVSNLISAQSRHPAPDTAAALWAVLVHELWRQELRVLRPATVHLSLPEPVAA